MPPEVIRHAMYSLKVDIWSFGIVMWEIFTKGGVPYPGRSNLDVSRMLELGTDYRMEQSEMCPDAIYNLMLDCWQDDATSRPEANALLEELKFKEARGLWLRKTMHRSSGANPSKRKETDYHQPSTPLAGTPQTQMTPQSALISPQTPMYGDEYLMFQ